MDCGISEKDFWEMTIAEFTRYMEYQARIIKRTRQEKALSDYKLADLIGKSISRIYSNNSNYPSIEEVYPELFDTEEVEEQKQEKQEKQDEISMMRFKLFAESFNKRREKTLRR